MVPYPRSFRRRRGTSAENAPGRKYNVKIAAYPAAGPGRDAYRRILLMDARGGALVTAGSLMPQEIARPARRVVARTRNRGTKSVGTGGPSPRCRVSGPATPVPKITARAIDIP